MRRPAVLLTACVASLSAAPARPAPLPPSWSDHAVPGHLATDIPINAVLQIGVEGGEFPVVATLSHDGLATPTSVPARFDDGVVTLELGEMTPQTTYTVHLENPSGQEPRDIVFTTGDQEDTEVPVLAAAPSVQVEHDPAPLPGETVTGRDSGVATNVITVTPPEASDNAAVAAFRLYEVNGDGTRTLLRARMVQEAADGMVFEKPEPGTYDCALAAVDVSGRESEPALFEIVVPSAGAFGCSARDGTASGGGWSALALAGLWVWRQRRSTR